MIGCATAFGLVALVRFVVSAGRTEYSLWPDEPAQLAMARSLGGGTHWTMHDHSTWRPGFALLLSPVHRVTSDPETVIRTAFGLNAVLGGVAAILLVVLARRLTSLGPAAATAAAIAVALTPALLFPTDFVWSESLLLPAYLASLLAILRLQESPSLRRGLAAGGLVAFAFSAHSRMLPLGVVVVGVVVVAARQERLDRRTAAVVVAATSGAFVAVQIASRAVVSQVWDDPASTNTVGAVLARITRPTDVAVSLVGQSWYLLISSVGIVGFGAVALWHAVRDVDGHDDGLRGRLRRGDAIVVAATVVACVGLSVVFMAGRFRADRVVYGRYNDAVIAPVLLVGLATLAGATSALRTVRITIGVVATTAVCAATLALSRDDALASSNGLEPMILGLQPFIRSAASIPVVAITVMSIAVGLAVVAAFVVSGRTRWTLVAPLALVAMIVVAGVRTHGILDRGWNGRGDFSDVGELADGALAGRTDVDFFLPAGSNSTDRLMLFQMYLPSTELRVVDDVDVDSATRYVFAPSGDETLRQAGASRVWTDRFGRASLWDRSTSR